MGLRGGQRNLSIAGGRYRPQTVSLAWAGAQPLAVTRAGLGCVYRTPKPARMVMKSEPRLEHAGDQHSKRVQDGNHREMMRRFYLTTLIDAGWNFGKGQDKGRRS